jgi:hypothetical protein
MEKITIWGDSMKYIQSKMSDFYKLKDDFKFLKEKLSEKHLDDDINNLIEKVQGDIEDLNDSKLLVKSSKIKDKLKVKVTYLTDNEEVIDENLIFDMDVNNPILDITCNKIAHKIEFFIIQKSGKNKVTKQVKNRVFDVIDIDLSSHKTQENIYNYLGTN